MKKFLCLLISVYLHLNLNHFAYLLCDIGRCLISVVVFILKAFVFIHPRLNHLDDGSSSLPNYYILVIS
jgi:hypothetical protein